MNGLARVGRAVMVRPTRSFTVCAGAVLVIVLAACGSSHAGSSASTQPPLGFRALPSFLPSPNAPVDTVMTASPGHPQLAVQGVGVAVDLAAGRTLATITGPRVPPFVSPPPDQVTAVFTISLTTTSGKVPVSTSAFTIADQLGRTYHPILVRGQTPLPTSALPGRTVTFELTAVMPTGEGRIYWAPNGGTPFVGWDFIVEND